MGKSPAKNLATGPNRQSRGRSQPNRPPGKRNLTAKSIQAKPNKTKQNCLDLLGFIRQNRDFSMGYEEKNKKNRLASQVVCKMSQSAFFRGVEASVA
jgi:hypothetical protein